jgi:hypothetical protein
MYCSACGQTVPSDSKFCPACGIAVAKISVLHRPIPWLYILLAVFVVCIVIVSFANFPSSSTAPQALTGHPETSIPASHPPVMMPGHFFLHASAQRGKEGEIVIHGATNLPDGMKVWVYIGTGRFAIQDPVFLKNGKFQSSRLFREIRNPDYVSAMNAWPQAEAESMRTIQVPFRAGKQNIRFEAYFNGAWQTPAILAFTGEGGSRLHGKLFVATDPDVVDSPKRLDVVEKISFPQISPTAKAIALVKRTTMTVPGEGRSFGNIEQNLRSFMNSGSGLSTAKGWSAHAISGDIYDVSYDYINGSQGEAQAVWSADLHTDEVKYLNMAAKIFSWNPNY